jgi:outer membrane protein OmpA-like peptidoglycan-associated protein
MSRRLASWLVFTVLAAAVPAVAQAQEPIRRVNVLVFEPSTSPLGVVTLDSSDTLKHLRWYAGLGFTYSHTPLRAARSGKTLFRFVGHHLAMDVVGALGIWKYFEVGVHLPAVLYQDGSDPDPLFGVGSSLGTAALGDLRLVAKVRFWRRQGRGFGLALVPQLTIPTGFSGAQAGEGYPTFEPRVVLDYQFAQGTLLTLNIGFRFRRATYAGNLAVGHELFYGIGAEVPVYRRRLAVLAEIVGAVGLQDAPDDPDRGIDEEEVPLEALVGVRYRFRRGFIVTAGAAVGLTNGWGIPVFRVFSGVGFTWGDAARPMVYSGDPDGDGIVGIADRCPLVPEDKDGHQDGDGCPDPDNDNDGVCDDNPVIQRDLKRFRNVCTGRDRCPNRKEVINGVEDEDGCPDKGGLKILLRGKKLIVLEHIYFQTGKSRIRRKSHSILRQLAALLRWRQDIKRVVVEGHTDERGSKEDNQQLSLRRAEAVRRFLMAQGIASTRLLAKGYGDSKPVARHCARLTRRKEKKACWTKNRRVVFRVLSN